MPAPGEYVGSYRVEEQIGAGGMATVYRAYHERLDRFVAIKILHQSMQSDPAFHARFEREARIVARLEHPNIVSIYDYNEYAGQPYLAMRYIEGRTLREILHEDQLSLDATIALMGKVADALTYAHSNGVLHRDIKPSNIIIDERGEPFITDFGLARIMQSGESTMSADVMLGTPKYISPEQAKGGMEVDARADVYSLGVVLYEMLTGRVPYKGDTPYAIVHDHIYTPPPAPRTVNPSISPAVESVLLKALAKRPEERFPTPTLLVNALQQAVYNDEAPVADDSIHDELFGNFGAELGSAGDELASIGRQISDELRGAFSTDQGDYKYRKSELKRHYRDSDMSKSEYRRRKSDLKRQYREAAAAKRAQEEALLTPEERLRQRVEKRVKARREEFMGLLTHLFWFVVINVWIFNLDGWVEYVVSGQGLFPGGSSWITLFWGIGIVSHFVSYWNDHGPGARQREAAIQREYERELRRYYGKRKNEEIIEAPFFDDEADYRGLRLTDDGEIDDGMIDGKRKNT